MLSDSGGALRRGPRLRGKGAPRGTVWRQGVGGRAEFDALHKNCTVQRGGTCLRAKKIDGRAPGEGLDLRDGRYTMD